MIELRPGDQGCVHSDGTIPDLINLFQMGLNPDHNSVYSHAFTLTDSNGNTFESRKKIGHYHIDDYIGMPMVIARHKLMTPELFQRGYDYVKVHDGATYPYMRLVLHALRLAKYIHWKHPVCAELNDKIEVGCLLRTDWWGVNPDNLSDRWHRETGLYEILYEGFWE
jgi:hypothetical protein